MVYKIRVILDVEENVIRDIAINKTDTLEELHNIITNTFGHDGSEMASFYLADDEWNQGEEFPLFDMSEIPGEVTQMSEIAIADVLSNNNDKLIYIYDFLNMWTFFVELMEINEEEPTSYLPKLLFSLGNTPNNAPEMNFESDKIDDLDDEDDDEFDFNEFGDEWN